MPKAAVRKNALPPRSTTRSQFLGRGTRWAPIRPVRSLRKSSSSCHLMASNPYSGQDRKSTRLNSSHITISYAVFCLKKKKKNEGENRHKTHNKQQRGQTTAGEITSHLPTTNDNE